MNNQMRKKELGPVPHALHKTNSKWILDLNVEHKPMKHLEENKTENLCDTALGYKSLDTKPKAESIKKKK